MGSRWRIAVSSAGASREASSSLVMMQPTTSSPTPLR
ncbi:Uncharacterised protein [Bordetella pertussis]|nr:Uncharacterised protein [Bordetella pertussis]CFU11989.1 Uncharacterised protein [Bordetella pertussis]CFW21243.1 Uncharacterised protein [Bordetella pertussis]